MYAIETIDGTRVRFGDTGTPQLRRDGSPKPCSARYRTTDPTLVRGKLQTAGYTVEVLRRRSPFWSAMQVQDRVSPFTDTVGDNHRALCKILLAHTGRDALRLQMGALRMACANQFLAPWVSIRHTDPRIDDFMDDPAAWVRDCLIDGPNLTKRVDALRDAPLLHDYTALMGLSDIGPRLKDRFFFKLRQYTYEGGASLWSLAQACTDRATENSPLRRAGMAVIMADPTEEARLESWRDAVTN